jgi:hypothetical protein
MKNLILFVICACSVLLAGCAYRGAVYSEYNQAALDIRASEASGAPVQVNFGYDQGVFAYVPKQNGDTNSIQGEAVSVVSWNNMATELNPTQTSTNTVLRVDAGFISGIAADVVSAPANSQVMIVAPNLTNTVSVQGNPGERIVAATTVFAPATIQVLTPDIQARKIALQKRLAGLAGNGDKAKQILADAGGPAVIADQAIQALQGYIAETSTPDAVKKLEDAFNKDQ